MREESSSWCSLSTYCVQAAPSSLVLPEYLLCAVFHTLGSQVDRTLHGAKTG